MINLYATNGIHKNELINTFESFDAAVAFVHSTYKVAFFEADEDHADCADFITKTGGLYMIQPATFTLG